MFLKFGLFHDSEQLSGAIGENPFYFTENLGQWDERVLFKAEGQNGLTWRLERDGLTLAISVPDTSTDPIMDSDPTGSGQARCPHKGHALKLRLFQSHLKCRQIEFLLFPPIGRESSRPVLLKR
ncbi:MAG: hypothetical protein HN356_10115 [Calditrichaeota bacterium]|jgi:hypothetical protein|nr:hypothetical protein [Calditrichota bacterium]MBT7616531.1 hypothetical protein [Calditrichota bacterium]MBT7787876.1 hypothetical protein [Calditrichota bacterium]